jgi:polar amino acid transport system substrate-binding protein
VKGAGAVLVSMILIACVSLASFAKERQVRIAGDPYPPWTEGEVGAKPTGGIAVEIVEELFRRLNMEALVNIYPFRRGLERIKHGEEDVILMVSRSKEREEYMLFSLPIRHVKFIFYYHSDLENFQWGDWKDLQPYNIGSVTGYNIGEDWKDAITRYNLRVEEVKTDVFNIEKLLLGRIDILVTDHEVMQSIIRQNPKYQGTLKWHEKPVFESVNNLGVSKKSFLAPTLPKINEVLQEMKDDGTFDRIFCAHDKIYEASCEDN